MTIKRIGDWEINDYDGSSAAIAQRGADGATTGGASSDFGFELDGNGEFHLEYEPSSDEYASSRYVDLPAAVLATMLRLAGYTVTPPTDPATRKLLADVE